MLIYFDELGSYLLWVQQPEVQSYVTRLLYNFPTRIAGLEFFIFTSGGGGGVETSKYKISNYKRQRGSNSYAYKQVRLLSPVGRVLLMGARTKPFWAGCFGPRAAVLHRP